MKKVVLFFLLFAEFCVYGFAQESIFLWPISNNKSGENILYRPNDYIADEINRDALIIFAEENTPIVSPVSGQITCFNYVYRKKYSSSIMFHLQPSSDYVFDCNEITKYYPQENYNPQYISITIGIKTLDGRQVYLSGSKPDKIFKTGEKVSQGDIIGKVGYLYHKINKPCISKGGY